MAEKQNSYIAIDLKSFYASVECISRGLDPMTTNLVVADESRTEKNDLPCCISGPQKLWNPWASTALRSNSARTAG